jgi:hypothetical protein
MIENDEQLRKAQDAVTYWRTMISKGGGSWLGNENARTEILTLRNQIADYERRRASATAVETSLASDTEPVIPADD